MMILKPRFSILHQTDFLILLLMQIKIYEDTY